MRYWAAAALLAAAIGWQSSIAYDFPTGAPDHVDKLFHAAAWALLAALIALGARARGWRPRAILALAIALAIAYGVVDELHQSTVPGRDASLLDLVADAVGAVVGSAGAAYARRHGDRS